MTRYAAFDKPIDATWRPEIGERVFIRHGLTGTAVVLNVMEPGGWILAEAHYGTKRWKVRGPLKDFRPRRSTAKK